jgi:hypothetical protein
MWLMTNNNKYILTVGDGCGSKSTDTDLTEFYSYVFVSMLASSGKEL